MLMGFTSWDLLAVDLNIGPTIINILAIINYLTKFMIAKLVAEHNSHVTRVSGRDTVILFKFWGLKTKL